MSAFLCSAETLAAIARFAASSNQAPEIASAVFDRLLDVNLQSLEARYPGEGNIATWCGDGEGVYTFENIPEADHTATEIHDMIRSYRYRSCEHDGWDGCPVMVLTDVLFAILKPMVKAEEVAEHAKQAARASALSKLPTLYPKQTAVAIRKLLKGAFPSTKFRVVTNRGSMVSSVGISWTDGPTCQIVESLTGCFEAGHFDGMTDSYNYDRDTVIAVEGVTYRPGCQYVSTGRTISATLANRCIKQLASYWGISEPLPVAVPTTYGSFSLPEGNSRPRNDIDDDWYRLIHQASYNASRFQREG